MSANKTDPAHNLWDELIALRDKQRAEFGSGLQVIKRAHLPLESNDFGLMRWYLHPMKTDAVLSTLTFLEQEIPPLGRSGRLKFQGGQVMLILNGRGYTSIDGIKHHWKKGDIVNLPIRNEGIVIQHINTDPEETARFVTTEPNWFACVGVDRGCGFEILEPASTTQE